MVIGSIVIKPLGLQSCAQFLRLHRDVVITIIVIITFLLQLNVQGFYALNMKHNRNMYVQTRKS